MATSSDIPDVIASKSHYPMCALNSSSRVLLAKHLNPERMSFCENSGLLQDWRGLAEELGFSALDIDNFKRKESPTDEVLREWMSKVSTPTIADLLNALVEIGRFDILHDTSLHRSIVRDVDAHIRRNPVREDPVQDDTVDSTDDDDCEVRTVGEANTGVREYFDAFICSTEHDNKFVQEMIQQLEVNHGLKLFITQRDLLGGAQNYVDLAKLIRTRCRKMIIVLSPDYLNSEACKFATLYAQSIHPGADKRSLIPVMYRKCKVPDILNFITLLDYTRVDIMQWFWKRLASSLRADSLSSNIMPPRSVTEPVLPSARMHNSSPCPPTAPAYLGSRPVDIEMVAATTLMRQEAAHSATEQQTTSADASNLPSRQNQSLLWKLKMLTSPRQ